MRSRVVQLALALFLSLGFLIPQALAKRAMTVEDLWRVKRVGAPQVSPDGRWVAFDVTTYCMENNDSRTDIWLIRADGGPPVRLTTAPGYDGQPRWNPADPSELAFISDRGGKRQIYLLSLRGGEALQLTNIPTGVNSFVWAPDGKRLAFTSRVYPGMDPKQTARRDEERAKSKVKARIYTSLLFRHWNTWWDHKRSHVFVYDRKTGQYVDLTPGDFDVPPVALGGYSDIAFSPDGRQLFYVANHDSVVAISTNNDIFRVPVAGGNAQKLTPSRGNDNNPVPSPDGRYLAYRAMKRPGFEADQTELVVLDLRTGQRVELTGELDRDVGEIVWGPDSKEIYFTCPDEGRVKIMAVDVGKSRVRTIVSEHVCSGLSVSPDGKWLYFRMQAMSMPNEIFRVRTDGTGLQKLTGFNDSLLAELELPEPEDFWFRSFDGTRVHAFVLKPPFFDPSKKYPLVYLIHGGPQGMWSDQFHFRWNAELFASPGYVVAMVNFRGSKGYGQKFCDAVSRNWGGGPYRDLMVGLDSLLAALPYVDTTRVAAAGASYGGFMINWIAGHSARFKALVCHDGVFDQRMMYFSTEELWFPEWEFGGPYYENPELYERWSPSNFVRSFRTPTLVIHGENDFRVPVTQGLAMFTALQRKGVPSKLLYFPDEDHFVLKPQNSRLWWNTVLDWIRYWLEKGQGGKP